MVIINRARLVKFDSQSEPPTLQAESGTTLNDIAQRAARLGLTGLEWAASVPGSLGAQFTVTLELLKVTWPGT